MSMEDLVAGFHNVANLRTRDETWTIDIAKCVEQCGIPLNAFGDIDRPRLITGTEVRHIVEACHQVLHAHRSVASACHSDRRSRDWALGTWRLT